VCTEEKKSQEVEALLAAKRKAGVTFDQIAEKIGLTNAYTAQLFYRQARWILMTSPRQIRRKCPSCPRCAVP
jgi:cyanate lyase